MISSLRLRNLRSFANSDANPFIDLKPLTVLVGKNSSGKSSFLRTLPLLRQSVEKKTTGPILWYGSYVDFGAYSEAKNKNNEDDLIYFDFLLNIDPNDRRSYLYRRKIINKKSANNQIDIRLELGVAQSQDKTVAKIIKIIIDKNIFVFSFDDNGKFSLIVNDTEQIQTDKFAYQSGEGFLPVFNQIINRNSDDFIHPMLSLNISFEDYLINIYFEKIKKFFWHTTSSKTIKNGMRKIGYCNKRNIYGILKSIFGESKTFIEYLTQNKKEVCDVFYEFSIRNLIFDVLLLANHELESIFKGVRYIAPLRATAERYYRHQDLQVDEIDHTGSNLAILLKSLSESEKRNFSKWTKENFGFSVRVEGIGLHYSIKIDADDDGKEYNISDMGFGYSQILPIIVSLWLELFKRNKRSKSIIFVIEQPELHLHPEYQSRLARLFSHVVSIARNKYIDLKIIFETHSKTMVDTLGDCIEENIIDKNDVNIVLFQKEASRNSSTIVSFSSFDENGYLNQWPVGFFSGRL